MKMVDNALSISHRFPDVLFLGEVMRNNRSTKQIDKSKMYSLHVYVHSMTGTCASTSTERKNPTMYLQ